MSESQPAGKLYIKKHKRRIGGEVKEYPCFYRRVRVRPGVWVWEYLCPVDPKLEKSVKRAAALGLLPPSGVSPKGIMVIDLDILMEKVKEYDRKHKSKLRKAVGYRSIRALLKEILGEMAMVVERPQQ